jgi:hypothetical protein
VQIACQLNATNSSKHESAGGEVKREPTIFSISCSSRSAQRVAEASVPANIFLEVFLKPVGVCSCHLSPVVRTGKDHGPASRGLEAAETKTAYRAA